MRRELENRLIKFTGEIITLNKFIKNSFEGEHLSKQLIRSGTSVALNFGEALGTYSRKDFIHKQSIVIKELRETYVNLRIIKNNNLCTNESLLNNVISECDELIRIFVKSLQTLQSKN
ncbi:MAG: four helix bundle protein [Bacteroidales bacterium]|jgi:four helix bundle protein|nr:four helix bundle protein [Bacteroidales bacterium]